MAKLEASTLRATCEALTHKTWDERNEIEPNPDISGPGVSVENCPAPRWCINDLTPSPRSLLASSAQQD